MPRGIHGYLLVLGAALAWSMSGIFIRQTVAGSGVSALTLAFWRDLATFLCLSIGLAVLRPGWLRVQRRDLTWLAALGIVGVGLFHFLWNMTMLRLDYAVATVLLYSSPAFVVLAAWLLLREKLTWVKVLAVALTLAGCVLVSGVENLKAAQFTAAGLILGLVTAMAYGSFSLLGRKVAGRYSPWTVLTYGFGFGVLALLPFQFGGAAPRILPVSTWPWFAGLILVSTLVPFSTYLLALRRLPASVASIVTSSEVVFGSLIGLWVYRERMDGWQALGAGLVLVGVILVAARGAASAGGRRRAKDA
jgi:drug/metabolite transporter (DMT)-like permease